MKLFTVNLGHNYIIIHIVMLQTTEKNKDKDKELPLTESLFHRKGWEVFHQMLVCVCVWVCACMCVCVWGGGIY